jgi:hypothetical protein
MGEETGDRRRRLTRDRNTNKTMPGALSYSYRVDAGSMPSLAHIQRA